MHFCALLFEKRSTWGCSVGVKAAKQSLCPHAQCSRENLDYLDATEKPGCLPLCYGRNVFIVRSEPTTTQGLGTVEGWWGGERPWGNGRETQCFETLRIYQNHVGAF